MSFRSTLLLANATVAAWLAVYHLLLEKPEQRVQQLWRHDSDAAGSESPPLLAAAGGRPERQQRGQQAMGAEGGSEGAADGETTRAGDERLRLLQPASAGSWRQGEGPPQYPEAEGSPKPSRAGHMGWRERLERTGAGDGC